MRKPKDSFSRGLIRMSWSKKNLFIIHQRGNYPLRLQNRTLFQQKWQAKKDTRAYHGAQLNERQFRRIFEPKLPTSLGGKEEAKHPPVSVLTYASLERRLDFIVFRSCFASSIWAARQMVVHGKVNVNGKKISAPSYLATDGDVISVNPHAIPFLSETITPKGFTFKPIPYMQPFLFIPEYLEVNFNNCSVVFLRDPISRPGRSEIPSPFPPETHSLAHEID
ncbi:15929_t:CDS:2 [Funneliformis geosporum]|uniref:6042_t:CDS:1 n=1 Tax=Funneliformis geosporum TaxID=1117311 RepID=A0A9W4SFZ4_9GLOM|nr:6042_t:CDS:2 [Funneliformis geosporum]CAI2176455.1 15929_t:CDS:2 [Funneliformis geosporum]